MRATRRLLVLGLLAVLAAVLSVPAAGAPAERQVFYDHASTYPRMIRLEHSGAANGRILASLSAWSPNGDGMGVISESTDGGETFQQISTIPDPKAAAGQGICCATLYELPQAVGDMPEGTLLWSDSVGFRAPEAQRHTRQRIWRSTDNGHTWEFLSEFGIAANKFPTWEPEFSVAGDGSLVAFYSDETDKARYDQKLVQVRSTDGVHWEDEKETVVDTRDRLVRPGMATVRRLPDGSYFLAYEVCNNDPKHLCSTYYRRSDDGWDYGDPTNLGTLVRTADGKYARHTPTLALTPDGMILLISKVLVNADGSNAPGNGKTILANNNDGEGPWREIPAPVAVADPISADCKNFSPTILPSADGIEVTEITTDLDGTVCKAYYGTAPLG